MAFILWYNRYVLEVINLNDFLKILILASIGSAIGWITNHIAIKLMFRPLNPISIAGVKFQGMVPRRKAEIAESIGKVVEEELLSMRELLEELMEEDNLSPVKNSMKLKIRAVVEEKLPGIIPSGLKNMLLSYIDSVVEEDGDKIIMEFIDDIADEENGYIKLSKVVEDKVNSFEVDRIEKIVTGIAKNEFKHIEVVGAFLGFFIGLVQGVIVIFA